MPFFLCRPEIASDMTEVQRSGRVAEGSAEQSATACLLLSQLYHSQIALLGVLSKGIAKLRMKAPEPCPWSGPPHCSFFLLAFRREGRRG